jgi:hypothetical protein
MRAAVTRQVAQTTHLRAMVEGLALAVPVLSPLGAATCGCWLGSSMRRLHTSGAVLTGAFRPPVSSAGTIKFTLTPTAHLSSSHLASSDLDPSCLARSSRRSCRSAACGCNDRSNTHGGSTPARQWTKQS